MNGTIEELTPHKQINPIINLSVTSESTNTKHTLKSHPINQSTASHHLSLPLDWWQSTPFLLHQTLVVRFPRRKHEPRIRAGKEREREKKEIKKEKTCEIMRTEGLVFSPKGREATKGRESVANQQKEDHEWFLCQSTLDQTTHPAVRPHETNPQMQNNQSGIVINQSINQCNQNTASDLQIEFHSVLGRRRLSQ